MDGAGVETVGGLGSDGIESSSGGISGLSFGGGTRGGSVGCGVPSTGGLGVKVCTSGAGAGVAATGLLSTGAGSKVTSSIPVPELIAIVGFNGPFWTSPM